jgi:hypothetical protein
MYTDIGRRGERGVGGGRGKKESEGRKKKRRWNARIENWLRGGWRVGGGGERRLVCEWSVIVAVVAVKKEKREKRKKEGRIEGGLLDNRGATPAQRVGGRRQVKWTAKKKSQEIMPCSAWSLLLFFVVVYLPGAFPPGPVAAFFSAGLRIWKLHIRVSSTDIIAPALSNSPLKHRHKWRAKEAQPSCE